MLATLVSHIPFAADEPFRVIELGSPDGELAESILNRFPHATLVAFEHSESGRRNSVTRLAPFGGRAHVRKYDVASLDWWDVMFGADLVLSVLQLQRLNDAKKRYLFKAVADRLSPRGTFLIADSVEPALLHQLIWLKHAGFAVADCFWLFERHAVFAGFKQAPAIPGEGSAPQPPADN
jgi:trans-aconitate methyltransferase